MHEAQLNDLLLKAQALSTCFKCNILPETWQLFLLLIPLPKYTPTVHHLGALSKQENWIVFILRLSLSSIQQYCPKKRKTESLYSRGSSSYVFTIFSLLFLITSMLLEMGAGWEDKKKGSIDCPKKEDECLCPLLCDRRQNRFPLPDWSLAQSSDNSLARQVIFVYSSVDEHQPSPSLTCFRVTFNCKNTRRRVGSKK